MNNKNNNNNHRAYGRAYDTEVWHNGRLGCWVEQEGAVVRALRWVLCALELVAVGFVVFGFCALCAVA